MKQLKFRYLRIQNFMCFGSEGLEIFFDDHGQVVIIRGENQDTGSPGNPASNGTGKSSIQDAISYCLYGKTVKKPKKLGHSEVINSKAGEKLEVEIQFDNFRIIRGRKPDKLQVWESSAHLWDKTTLVSKGKGTQQFIEEKIGLNHTAFCQVLVFDDSDKHSFLELDSEKKRQIVENLLDLEKFAVYLENIKKKHKLVKNNIEELTREYSNLLTQIDGVKQRQQSVTTQEQNWRIARNQEVVALTGRISEKQAELAKTDENNLLLNYQKAQDRMAQIYEQIPDLNEKKAKLETVLEEVKTKFQMAQLEQTQLKGEENQQKQSLTLNESNREKSKGMLASLKELKEGQQCNVCKGVIEKKNYANVLLHEENCLSSLESTIASERSNLLRLGGALKSKTEFISKLQAGITDGQTKLKNLQTTLNQLQVELTQLNKVEKPDISAKQQVLEAEITELKRQLTVKQKEAEAESPYKEILEQTATELAEKVKTSEEKAVQLKDLEKNELPYYEYWLKGFGDKGIRKIAVDQIIPSLNARIAYWLRHLIDGKIELTFNDELQETIKRSGVMQDYHGMSNGESRRINLAVSQAFAYVMTMNSGACLSLLFLDEITGGGIDEAGIVGVYNTIFELAKERQVFVTTHNRTLIDMLQGCEEILLVKKDDITRRIV